VRAAILRRPRPRRFRVLLFLQMGHGTLKGIDSGRRLTKAAARCGALTAMNTLVAISRRPPVDHGDANGCGIWWS